jgi:hypothetical protein
MRGNSNIISYEELLPVLTETIDQLVYLGDVLDSLVKAVSHLISQSVS